MKRREFISLVGGAALASCVAGAHTTRAQQGERMRRISVLFGQTSDEPETQRRLTAFKQGLRQLGWVEGQNVRTDIRWAAGDQERLLRDAAELVALAPDIIFAAGNNAVEALKKATRTVPIVFGSLLDPVGSGVVVSLARPGGNITGFTGFEYATSAKWLQLLKELAPAVKRVAVFRESSNATGIGQWAAIQTVAPSLGVELTPINTRDASEMERAVAEFAKTPNGGLIAAVGGFTTRHSNLIIALAARHRLPAVYPYVYFTKSGGLMSYGPDSADQYRLAAGYVDRILKGAKPADLPVQAATKFELAINLKTAKTLGLSVSPQMLTRADEVIE